MSELLIAFGLGLVLAVLIFCLVRLLHSSDADWVPTGSLEAAVEIDQLSYLGREAMLSLVLAAKQRPFDIWMDGEAGY